MNRVQQAVDKFRSGFNCAQAILETYGPDYDLSPIDCLKVSSGFGGGMRRAEVCGAVTGALMVLGLQYGPKHMTDTSRKSVYAKVADFSSRFETRCGSIICRDLLECDVSTAQGMQQAIDKDLFKTVCPELVRVAAEILEEL
jgi:C_GCAxxG_C_C family probable redox protein